MEKSNLDSKIEELRKKVLDFVMPKVKAGQIKFEDFQDMSADMLNLLDGLEVEEELSAVLFVLSQKWPILAPLFQEVKIKEIAAHEAEGKDDSINAIREKLLKFTDK